MSNLQNMFDETSPQAFVRYSEETRAKLNAGHKGLKRSDETRAKMSAASPRLPGWNKGKKFSPEQCEKYKGSHPGKGGHNKQSVMTPYGVFSSQGEANKSLGIYHKRLKKYMLEDPTNWYYIQD